MKNFSGTFVMGEIVGAIELSAAGCAVGVPPTIIGSEDPWFGLLTLAVFGAGSWSVAALGGSMVVGALAELVEPLLRRQTNRTPWNLESWNRFIAATHAASDL